LLKYVLKRIVLGVESVSIAPNDVLSDKFRLIFLQQLNTKDLPRKRYAWYSSVAQFALPLKMKPSRQDTVVTWSVLYP